jgi:hypothetical protein
MPDNPNQPKPYDAVIGGQNPPPSNGAVLGGLQGVKTRIANASLEIRKGGIREALKYGQDGLELAIQALEDPAEEVQWFAYLLLKTRSETSIRNALQDYIPVIYRKLRGLLETGNWKDADGETAAAMLKVAGREKQGWLRVEDISRFPSDELRIIDQLWLQYSNGRFGFSIQKQIWQSVGNNYSPFGDRVRWRQFGGWLSYSQFSFTAEAPEGHLPAAHLTWDSLKRDQTWLWYGGTVDDVRWFELKSLLSRRDL